MLLAMVTNKPGYLNQTWTVEEIQVIKRYYLYFRFPNASREFSGLFSGIQLLTFAWKKEIGSGFQDCKIGKAILTMPVMARKPKIYVLGGIYHVMLHRMGTRKSSIAWKITPTCICFSRKVLSRFSGAGSVQTEEQLLKKPLERLRANLK